MTVAAIAAGAAGQPVIRSLSQELLHYASVRIDAALVFVLLAGGLTLLITRRGPFAPSSSHNLDRIRVAATSVLAAVAFLVPITLLGVQFVASSQHPTAPGLTPRVATIDLLVAAIWLSVSVICGVLTITVAALSSKDTPERSALLLFLWEIGFVLVGVFRLIWGMFSLVEFILRKFG